MTALLKETGTSAGHLLAALEGSRAWQNTLERLRALRALPGDKPGAYALHETIAAARPALLAALARELGGTLLAVVATPDAAERSFADLLYYLGEQRRSRGAAAFARRGARSDREPVRTQRAPDAAGRSRRVGARASSWRRSPRCASR